MKSTLEKSLTIKGIELNLRLVEKSDTDGLYKYYRELSPLSQSRFGPHSFDKTWLELMGENPDPNLYRFIASPLGDNNILACFLVLKGFVKADVPRFKHWGFTLDPENNYTLAPSVADYFHDQGIGSSILQCIFLALEVQQAKRIFLWGGVQPENSRAIHFYEKHGFERIGEFRTTMNNYDMIKYL